MLPLHSATKTNNSLNTLIQNDLYIVGIYTMYEFQSHILYQIPCSQKFIILQIKMHLPFLSIYISW